MKAILEFQLPEDQREHKFAIKGKDYILSLWEISQEIFRNARKHGYPDKTLNDYIEGENGEKFIFVRNGFTLQYPSCYQINLMSGIGGETVNNHDLSSGCRVA